MQQVADLSDQRVFKLIEPTVGVGDLPEQPHDFRLLVFVEVPVKNLREFIHGDEFFGLLISLVNELRGVFGRQPEMFFNKQQHTIELAVREHVIRSRDIDHQDGRREAQRSLSIGGNRFGRVGYRDRFNYPHKETFNHAETIQDMDRLYTGQWNVADYMRTSLAWEMTYLDDEGRGKILGS